LYEAKSENLLNKLEELNEGYHLIILNERIAEQKLDDEFMIEVSNSHIVHAGLTFLEKDSFFELMKPLVTNWHFLDPTSKTKNFSWKATSHLCFFKKGVIAALGGFERCYSSDDAEIADMAYRCLVCGGRVVYMPFLNNITCISLISTSLEDDLSFARRHLNVSKIFIFSVFNFLSFRWLSLFKTLLWQSKQATRKFQKTHLFDYFASSKVAEIDQPYTAIIPTISRYDYLDKAIYSLLNNSFPPSEIIVVDQTPISDRRQGFYDEFGTSVKVFFLDEPGQCTSRNLGIREAKYELILLFEDDAEAWPEMIIEHFKVLNTTNAIASTGISLAPWKDRSYIPERISFYQNSDVLATGNCLIKKSAILAVNGLHLAYNRGSGADDDLGRRLYLAGHEIIFNPFAIETHHKAPMGGMRVHGAFWRNKTKLTQAFPPTTELFTFKQYYKKEYYYLKVLYSFISARKRNNFIQYIQMLLLAPLKYGKSVTALKKLRATK